MQIIGFILGLIMMVILIPSVGFFAALVIGALAGGIVGFVLKSLVGGMGLATNPVQEGIGSEDDIEQRTRSELRKQIAKLKNAPIPASERPYLEEIFSAVEKGNANAYWRLGDCLNSGVISLMEILPKDKKGALFWYHRSAEMGLASSQYHLGLMYLGDTARQLGVAEYSNDSAVIKNIGEAIKWLNLAANQSDTFAAFAQDVLGEMYFLGIGLKQNYAVSFDLFSRSVSNPENLTIKFGLPTRGTERLPELKSRGYPQSPVMESTGS